MSFMGVDFDDDPLRDSLRAAFYAGLLKQREYTFFTAIITRTRVYVLNYPSPQNCIRYALKNVNILKYLIRKACHLNSSGKMLDAYRECVHKIQLDIYKTNLAVIELGLYITPLSNKLQKEYILEIIDSHARGAIVYPALITRLYSIIKRHPYHPEVNLWIHKITKLRLNKKFAFDLLLKSLKFYWRCTPVLQAVLEELFFSFRELYLEHKPTEKAFKVFTCVLHLMDLDDCDMYRLLQVFRQFIYLLRKGDQRSYLRRLIYSIDEKYHNNGVYCVLVASTFSTGDVESLERCLVRYIEELDYCNVGRDLLISEMIYEIIFMYLKHYGSLYRNRITSFGRNARWKVLRGYVTRPTIESIRNIILHSLEVEAFTEDVYVCCMILYEFFFPFSSYSHDEKRCILYKAMEKFPNSLELVELHMTFLMNCHFRTKRRSYLTRVVGSEIRNILIQTSDKFGVHSNHLWYKLITYYHLSDDIATCFKIWELALDTYSTERKSVDIAEQFFYWLLEIRPIYDVRALYKELCDKKTLRLNLHKCMRALELGELEWNVKEYKWSLDKEAEQLGPNCISTWVDTYNYKIALTGRILTKAKDSCNETITEFVDRAQNTVNRHLVPELLRRFSTYHRNKKQV